MWQAQISHSENGRRVRRTSTHSTRREAALALRSMRAQVRNVDPARAGSTVADAILAYEAHLASRVASGTLAESTRTWYLAMLRAVPDDLRARRLDDVRPSDIEAWVASLPGSRSAVRGAYVALGNAWKVALRDRMTSADPFRDVTPPAPGREREPRVATRADVDALVAAAPEPYCHWYRLLADTGLRRGELLALTWGDVVDGAIMVRGGKTRAARRIVPLTPAARAAVAALPRGADGDPVVTVSGQQLADRMKSLSGLNPHSLRHGAATRLLEAGVSPHVVAAILGHSSPVITMTAYAHIIGDAERDAMRALE